MIRPSRPLLIAALLSVLPILTDCIPGYQAGQLHAEGATSGTLWERIQYSNGIVAVVEDRIITLDELRRELTPLLRQIQREATSMSDFEDRVELIGKEVVQNLVDRILTVKEFEKEGFQVPQSYIENEFDDFIAEQYDNDRSLFLKDLKEQGQSMQEFRDQLRERLIVGYMRGRFRRSISEVRPEKIEKFYAENRDAFFQEERILLKQITLAETIEGEMEVTAQKIREQLEQGAVFSELAKQYSQDEKAQQGGSWGWINRSDIRKELADAAFSLNEGTYSDPVQLDGYLFILYVEAKQEEGLQPLEQVRAVIEETLIDELTRQAQERWIDQIRKNAFVKLYI